ncbi:MAG TPA: OmpA family protein [Paludibacteraceae bacterium]|nr:OmpA family protein [Paludibacteraceae bacterium]
MNYKIKAILIVVLCHVSFTLQADDYSTKSRKAIALYEKARISYSSTERETLLNKAIKRDKKFVEAYWALAQQVMRKKDYKQAIEILSKINTPKFPYRAQTQYMIAELNFLQGEYESAIDMAESITESSFIAQKTQLLIKYLNAQELKNNPVPFDPINLTTINTRFDDYFPSITADGSMISTTVLVEESQFVKQEDLYWSQKNGDTWQIARPLLPPINTPGNEGSQSFSSDGRYMFFVACDRKEGSGSCDIYYAIRSGDRWSTPINIGAPVNTAYWESNPVLSPTGDELFFVSNRPPSLGGKDIWRCDVTILENGFLKFSNPQNIGTPINTDKDDFAPFIHADNKTLYFASNGHHGLGLSDIFYSQRTSKNTWSEPKNIGYPINTHGEESGFVVNAAGDKAYFASDHVEEENKGLDIYEITLHQAARPDPMAFIVGRIYDAETQTNLDAYVEIFNTHTSEKIYESVSDKKLGTFTAYLPPTGYFGVNARRKGYLFYSDNIKSMNDSLIIALQPATPGSKIILHNLFFAFNSAEIQPQSEKEILYLFDFLQRNSKIRIEITGHTDNVGSEEYNQTLSLNRAQALFKALQDRGIAAERMNALGKGSKVPISSNSTEEGRANNRRVEVKIL